MGDRETSDEVCRVDPPISERLRARIDRDFDRRWSQTWGGRFILHGRTVPNDSVRLDGNDYLAVTGHPAIVAAQIDALPALTLICVLGAGYENVAVAHAKAREQGIEAPIVLGQVVYLKGQGEVLGHGQAPNTPRSSGT